MLDIVGPTAEDRTAARRAATVVGAVAIGTIALLVVNWLFWRSASAGQVGSPSSDAGGWAATGANATQTLRAWVLPAIGVGLAFALTAVRELPVRPAAIGAFAGALLAPLGNALGSRLLFGEPSLAGADLLSTLAVWTETFVLPVVLAVLAGAAARALWDREVATPDHRN